MYINSYYLSVHFTHYLSYKICQNVVIKTILRTYLLILLEPLKFKHYIVDVCKQYNKSDDCFL